MDLKTNVFGRSLKAQFWSFDVIFAMVIFVLALSVLGFTWYNVNNQLSLSYGGGATIAQLQTHSLAQNLLSTGSPANWQSVVNTTNSLTWSNVSVGLGLSPSGSNLSIKKIYTLMAMTSNNYQATKLELGISYDYYVTITGGSINLAFGSSPYTNNALTVYVEKRSAFVGGTPVTMQVLLWTNTSLAIS